MPKMGLVGRVKKRILTSLTHTHILVTFLLSLLSRAVQARIPGVYRGGSWQDAHATFYGGSDASGTVDAAYYCICNDGLSDAIYQKNIDYACGAGADCTPIMQYGPCFQPNTVENHCNFAVNSYYQRNGQVQGSCSFSNTAIVVQDPPPSVIECVYPCRPRAFEKPIIHFSLSIKITLVTGLAVTIIGFLELFRRCRRSAQVNEGESHQEAANHTNRPGEIEINTAGSSSITLDSEV